MRMATRRRSSTRHGRRCSRVCRRFRAGAVFRSADQRGSWRNGHGRGTPGSHGERRCLVAVPPLRSPSRTLAARLSVFNPHDPSGDREGSAPAEARPLTEMEHPMRRAPLTSSVQSCPPQPSWPFPPAVAAPTRPRTTASARRLRPSPRARTAAGTRRGCPARSRHPVR